MFYNLKMHIFLDHVAKPPHGLQFKARRASLLNITVWQRSFPTQADRRFRPACPPVDTVALTGLYFLTPSIEDYDAL